MWLEVLPNVAEFWSTGQELHGRDLQPGLTISRRRSVMLHAGEAEHRRDEYIVDRRTALLSNVAGHKGSERSRRPGGRGGIPTWVDGPCPGEADLPLGIVAVPWQAEAAVTDAKPGREDRVDPPRSACRHPAGSLPQWR